MARVGIGHDRDPPAFVMEQMMKEGIPVAENRHLSIQYWNDWLGLSEDLEEALEAVLKPANSCMSL